MAMGTRTSFLFLFTILLFLALASPAAAFGAGNIASIAKIEGKNWRHGDIEDTLKTLLALKGGKWTAMNVRRVYFGNWLRDYSQALDVGTLKSVNKDTIRILVWVLSFLSFGYATGEFEVTEERLGVYRPEEHIDNPKDYADNMDARHYDPRLRPPVHPTELAIDPLTGMKNYVANETGGWATSTGYVKHSLTRSIHFGRLYTSGGHGVAGREEDLCEALRCLGQALHCLEDFSAHTNYIELTLRELGFHSVFPHTGVGTEVMAGLGAATPAQPGAPPYGGYAGGHPVHQQQPMGGGPMKRVFPLVTGTFGAVDFLHSVLGEAQDKFSQTEVDELDNVLGEAHEQQKKSERSGQKSVLQGLLQQIPSLGGLSGDADRLEAQSNAKEMENMHIAPQKSRGPAGAGAVPPSGGFDPVKTARDIYPILEFRDKVMRSIEEAIERIPGLSALVEKISDTLSLFVLSLLAPYVRPIIAQASLELKVGSSAVVDSSAAHQFEPWTIPTCTDPTHSLLSKDHFSNKLNTPAGEVASAILAYAVPRIVYAWENPTTPVEMVLHDVTRVFHHPALRDPNAEVQTTMFNTVTAWVERLHDKGASLNDVLSSEGVRAGKNHEGGVFAGGHGGGHGKLKSGEWDKAKKKKKDKESRKDSYSGIPGISSSGGSVSVGGVKIPGPIGGILDAVAAGYPDGGGGGSSSGKYKEEKYHDKEKKKEKKEKHYDEYDKDRKDKKDKDKDKHKDKDKKDKRDKKDKKDKKHYSEDEGSEDERRYRRRSGEHGHGGHGYQTGYQTGYPGGYPGGY